MKTTIIGLILLFITCTTGYTQTITAAVSGNWTTANTWSLNRVPQNGDTVVIPAGRLVTISSNINISTSRLVLYISGTLRFNSGGAKLAMHTNSSIVVFPGGSITSTGSPSQQISIGSNTVFRGTDPPVSGPVFADGNTTGFDLFDPLPVRYLSFALREVNGKVHVTWVTTEEVNVLDYIIQRSVNGSVWVDLDTVPAKGSPGSITEYSWSENEMPASLLYYRIRQRDVDGKSSFTPIQSILISSVKKAVRVFSQAPGNITVQFLHQINGPVAMKLVNMKGQVVKNELLNIQPGMKTFTIHQKGIFIIWLVYENNYFSQKICL